MPTPGPFIPYKLALGQPRVLTGQTGAVARILRIGPMLSLDYGVGAPTLEAVGSRVDMAIARVGTKTDLHQVRCSVDGLTALRFEHRRGSAGIESRIGQALGTLVANQVVNDGDDGKVDHIFTYEFFFGDNPKDLLIIRGETPAKKAWVFRNCQVLMKGLGFPSTSVPPVPLITPVSQTAAYRISAARPRYRKMVGSVELEAGLATVFLGQQYEDFLEGGNPIEQLGPILWQNPAGPVGSTIFMRVVRTGGPGQKQRMRCRTTSPTLRIEHFRPKPGVQSIKDLANDVVPFTTAEPAATGAGAWRTFFYEFFPGLTGQELFKLTFASGSSIFDFCTIDTAPKL